VTPERWRQIKDVFDAAMALSPPERETSLSAACAGDSALRREVESLIDSHQLAASGFLHSPWTPPLTEPPSAPFVSGSRIGPYLLGERLGRGGMGEVFAAVRADGQYEQRVAIKLVRAGFSSPDLVERFRAERQILAGLDHPHIARLLDGGTTDEGAPYLVMELIDGVSIDAFCRERGLSVRERLTMFLPVCAAVQFAHQRLVIHRDLKPGNILVTRDGAPKLLDFGIAKILDPLGNTRETTLRPLTLDYASPEQVRGEAVSTASDVYALGVVLYQLLTGRLPYANGARSSAELAQAITSRDPEKPSTNLAADIAPGTTHPSVERELRGDVDAILLKALRKEPDKRYASAEQFAGDIRRHLDGLPVGARTGTWNYHAMKFVRRHRASVAAAALVLGTLVAGIVVTAREARIAEANRRRADARFNDVRKLANSLLFEINDSIQNLPGATDARKLILQRSVEYLDSLARESGDDPDLLRELATAYDRIGSLQAAGYSVHLGDTKSAADNFQKALTIRQSLARANPQSARDRIELAGAYKSYGEFEMGSLGDARRGFDDVQRALRMLEKEAQASPLDPRLTQQTRECLTTLGFMQIGNGLQTAIGTPAEGIADLERAQQLLTQQIAKSPDDSKLRERQGLLEVLIAQGLMFTGDRPNAIGRFQRGIDILEPLARQNNYAAALNVMIAMTRIGDALLIDGRIAESLPHYGESARRSAAMAAIDPHNDAVQQADALALVTMGHALDESGRIDEGTEAIHKGLAKIAAAQDSPDTRAREALARGWLGEALERQGKLREASQQYALTKARLGELLTKGIDNPRTQGFHAVACDRLGAVLVSVGEIDAGVREYDEAQRRLEPVVTAYPAMQELAYALADTYTRQAVAASIRAERAQDRAEKQAQWRAARDGFQRSLDVWKRIEHPAWISGIGFEVTLPADVARKLAQSDRAIQALGSTE
jgi:non-specific serine/threonine protein kinase/serine/threonine-protein kinase